MGPHRTQPVTIQYIHNSHTSNKPPGHDLPRAHWVSSSTEHGRYQHFMKNWTIVNQERNQDFANGGA